MKMVARALVIAMITLVPVSAQAAAPEAVFLNAKIVTMDAGGSTAEAVAVQDGKILKVGSAEEIKKLAGPSTRLIDLGGKTVVPGLIDAHCHPMETLTMKENWVDCRYPGCPSVKQALINIAEYAKKTPKGKWIFVACVSASENKFAEKRLPTKAELNAAAPDNPLLLANGTHMGVANSAALKVLGVKKGTRRLPGGGTVILDKKGEPTGVLTDAQADVPYAPSVADLERYYTGGIQEFWNQHGFTSFLAITPAEVLPVLQKVAEAKIPTLRYSTSIWTSANGKDMPADVSKFRFPPGADPAYYRFLGLKVWIDGENDCRTGYMYQPYLGKFATDPPGGKGTLVTDQKWADHFAAIAQKAGVVCMMHCSGDHAMDIGMNAYEKIIKTGRPRSIMRVEHFGMFQMNQKQLARAKEMKKQDMYISVQPVWLLDLVKADFENMGEKRTRTGFQFRAMIDAGLEPAASTDCTGIYLGNVNPFWAIYAAVTRQSDAGIFEPGQAISVTEALKMWTIWAARSMGEADVKGSLEPGKYADMTVLSDDIFTMPKENLKDVKALKTIVGGKIVYEAN
jgi:hypothetical protein